MSEFGYHPVAPASEAQIGALLTAAMRAQAGNTGELQSIAVYIWASTPSGKKYTLGLYSDNAGEPDELLATCEEGTTSGSAGWVVKDVAGTKPTLTNGTYYWLTFINEDSAVNLGYDATTASSRYYNSGGYSHTLPASYSESNTPLSNIKWGIYGTIEAGVLEAGTINADSIHCTTCNLTCGEATGGTPDYTYQWYRSEVDDFTPGSGNIMAGETSLTLADSGLTPGTTYYYKLVATDDIPDTDTSEQCIVLTCVYNLVCDGDSLTKGAPVAPETYPHQVADILGTTWGISNMGEGSHTLATLITEAATEIDPLFESGALENILVIWGGANDIAQSASAVTTHGRLDTYCTARQAAGWTVICVTITKGDTVDDEVRVDTNVLTRADWFDFADGIADPTMDARLQDTEDETYFSDGIHFTEVGYGIIAANVAATILAVLNGMGPEGGGGAALSRVRLGM